MRAWMMALGACAGLMGAAGVALAAVGAHLDGRPMVTTAANFLLFHAGLVVALCVLARIVPRASVLCAASLVAIGSVLFSGELALHTLAGVTGIGAAAPIGGALAIAGWFVTALAAPLALGRRP